MVDFQDAPDKAIGMMKQKKFILVQTRPNFNRPIYHTMYRYVDYNCTSRKYFYKRFMTD